MPVVSPSVCGLTAGSNAWQFSATPNPPQPINRLGQVFSAQYKGQYLALDAAKTLMMQSQPFYWSLEATSATESTLWGIFAAVPLDYMSGPTSIPYIAAPSSPTASLAVTNTDPGSDTPFYLNANGVWFAVDSDSHYSIYAPSVQQFYVPSSDAKSLVPSQDVSQIYGWTFQAIPSPVIGTVLPSGDYYFTVKSSGGDLFLNSSTQNQAAVLMPTFDISASIFSWHAESPATFSPKCNPTWNADETMNTFFLTFIQESPMQLPFQVTDKGGIITTNAPNMTFIGLPYQRKNSTVVILFRPSAWPLLGNNAIVLPVAYGTAVLPPSIADGTYQIKHENAYLNAQGQLGNQAVNWNYDSKTNQLSLASNPSLCLLNANAADVCASKTIQSLTVGNCTSAGSASSATQRFLLGQDGTFRDPLTKLCYNDTLLSKQFFRGMSGGKILGKYPWVSFVIALVVWLSMVGILIWMNR